MQPRTRAFAPRTAGLTIIEVLVSIALLSVIVLVVLTPLTGFFGLSRQSNQQVRATQAAQRAMEALRGDWLDTARYDQNCLSSAAVLEALRTENLRIEVTALDVNDNAIGSLPQPGACGGGGAAGGGPPLKRVQVAQTDAQGKILAELTVVVDRR